MIYDLSTPMGKESFKTRCNHLYRKGCVVDLTEKSLRTNQQNSYLHLIIGVVAMYAGTSLEYAKQEYFKRICNPDIFVITREDRLIGTVTTLKSSADVTKEEMSIAIDRFKKWGADNGIYLPNPGDEEILRQIAIEMGKCRSFL